MIEGLAFLAVVSKRSCGHIFTKISFDLGLDCYDHNVNYIGPTFKITQESTVGYCQERCLRSRSNCLYFSYDVVALECVLITSITTKDFKSTSISGPNICPLYLGKY